MVSSNTLLIIFVGVFFAGVIAYYVMVRNAIMRHYANYAMPAIEKFTPADFTIYNYLPNHSIVIDIISNNNGEADIVTRLPNVVKPLSTTGLTKEQVEKYLKGGNTIRISVTTPQLPPQLYTEYFINTDPETRIKNLHVGMITTRFIGSTDGLRMTTAAGNAVQGNATLKIHNLTYLPLDLIFPGTDNNANRAVADAIDDEVIHTAPHSSSRYLGYLHQGVTLGTIFGDAAQLYPNFQYLAPHSDLYYGVVSDIRQPLSGCQQLEFNDDCDYGQTLWPFQEGVM